MSIPNTLVNISVSISWSDGADLDTCISYNGVMGGWSCGSGNGWGGDNTSSNGGEYYSFIANVDEIFTFCCNWYGSAGTAVYITITQSNGIPPYSTTMYPIAAQGCSCSVGTCSNYTVMPVTDYPITEPRTTINRD